MALVTVRSAGVEDLPAAGAAFGAGALDEAVYSWVIPDESTRRQRLVEGESDLAAWLGGMLHAGEILVAGDETRAIAGVSLWQSVDPAEPTSPDEAIASAAFIERTYGEHAPRMLRMLELVGERNPREEPHLYLMTIVVVPELRSSGLGGAMLRHRLTAADAAGVPAYLEASTPRNRALYERHGFRDLDEPISLPDGPSRQPMWRTPAG